jgi:hypothetical protein
MQLKVENAHYREKYRPSKQTSTIPRFLSNSIISTEICSFLRDNPVKCISKIRHKLSR